MNFRSHIIFNDIIHGYRAAWLKKNSLWLLLFYMAVASYCFYEKVRRTMHTAIVSYLLKYFYSFSAAELCNIESEDKVFAHEFSYEESDYGDSNQANQLTCFYMKATLVFNGLKYQQNKEFNKHNKFYVNFLSKIVEICHWRDVYRRLE